MELSSSILQDLGHELYYIHIETQADDPFIQYVDGTSVKKVQPASPSRGVLASIENDRLTCTLELSVSYSVVYDLESAIEDGTPIPKEKQNQVYTLDKLEVKLIRDLDWIDLPDEYLVEFDLLDSVSLP